MRSPQGSSGVRLAPDVQRRLKRLFARLKTANGVQRRLLTDRLQRELGLAAPELEARRLGFRKLVKTNRKRVEAKKVRASAEAIFEAALPTLGEMKKFFRDGVEVSPETIQDLLTSTEPEWAETAKRAHMLATAFKGYGPFEWNEDSVGALLKKRPVDWLEQRVAQISGMGAATIHNLRYRRAVTHRPAK